MMTEVPVSSHPYDFYQACLASDHVLRSDLGVSEWVSDLPDVGRSYADRRKTAGSRPGRRLGSWIGAGAGVGERDTGSGCSG